MTEEFHRIKRLPPYVFEQVNKLKAAARARGEDIIDFGMGNPDLPTPDHIVEKLIETVKKPRTNRYSASRGIPGLRRAQAGYYERRFGVKLNPDTQVVATLGSKEGFANMAQAITAPGDVILVPNPTYPIHEFGFIISGATIRHIPASVDHEFLDAVDKAVRHSVPKPIALVLNYPSNPTALMASLDFYKEIVDYASKHDLIILSDVAYAEIYFDNDPPPSILQVPGAMDVAVEFSSLSKTYSMPGWRMGFCVGNERLVAALARVKVLSRLRRIHADPGRGHGRAERPAGLHRGDAPDLQAQARLPGRDARPRGLDHSVTSRHDVRLGSAAAGDGGGRIARIFEASPGESRRSGVAGTWASANMARAMFASRSSKTSTASGRPGARSRSFFPRPSHAAQCHSIGAGFRRALRAKLDEVRQTAADRYCRIGNGRVRALAAAGSAQRGDCGKGRQAGFNCRRVRHARARSPAPS